MLRAEINSRATTFCGLGIMCCIVAIIVTGVVGASPTTSHSVELIALLLAGLQGVLARDARKSSQDAGIR